ncbi:MAG: OmpH family outer membrane protein [Candidatus Paracaedimonas acanthamoebae]|uniref:OmpH family outer membrane protein n=1 Tax=Candidatus Paracaedimonas acanthamoebae TaxID=244581 RepID=A0A8J7Q1U1_9PROT|nr:OmpH family outer membrane protein [Candidatus Paracaedimonas acanthamoebae]
MKLSTSKLFLASCLGLGILASPLKAAEDSLKVAIVDVDKLMQASKSAKQLITELEKQRTKFQEEVSKHEEKLRELEKKLIEEQKKLSSDEFNKKREEFERQVAQVHEKVGKRREQLEKAFSDAREDIQKVILKLVVEASEKNKYTLVLPRSVVIFREDRHEITDVILKQLDEKLPKVDFKVPTA